MIAFNLTFTLLFTLYASIPNTVMFEWILQRKTQISVSQIINSLNVKPGIISVVCLTGGYLTV